MQDCPSVKETFQLMLANKRAEVIALAERLAIQSRAQDHIVQLPAGQALNVTLSWSAGLFRSGNAEKLS